MQLAGPLENPALTMVPPVTAPVHPERPVSDWMAESIVLLFVAEILGE